MGTEAVAGLVLAAGGSRRLGRPKQLLPFGGGTLLGHVLGTARACRFDQLVCVLGGASEDEDSQPPRGRASSDKNSGITARMRGRVRE